MLNPAVPSAVAIEPAARATCCSKVIPSTTEARARTGAASGDFGRPRFLLPKRGAVENHRDDRCTLYDLNQTHLAEMPEQQAK